MLGRILASLLLFLCALGVISDPSRPSMLFQPGDQLRVVVLGFPELTSDCVVLPDGSIAGVGFGVIKAEGKSVVVVQKEVAQKLRAYVREPQVSIMVSKARTDAVYLVRQDPRGPIGSSGPGQSGGFPYQPDMELRQLLALAQMPAKPELYETTVYRNGSPFKEVSLSALIQGSKSEWNGPLLPGDLVTILPRPVVNVWVTGLVRQPGEYSIPVGSSISDALDRGLGTPTETSPNAKPLRVMIRRGGQEWDFAMNALPKSEEFGLQTGDTITVRLPEIIRVSVAGEVMRPGDYEVEPETSLSQLVGATAGGPTQTGTLLGCYVMRGNEVFVVDATPPSNTRDNFTLKPNDVVYVFPNRRAIYVFGTVKTPGLKLIPDDKPIHLADALALAGGISDRGTYRRVAVMKREGDKLVPYQYNLDEYLKDGNEKANPRLDPGDIVLFGQPRGITLSNLSQLLTNVILFENLVRR